VILTTEDADKSLEWHAVWFIIIQNQHIFTVRGNQSLHNGPQQLTNNHGLASSYAKQKLAKTPIKPVRNMASYCKVLDMFIQHWWWILPQNVNSTDELQVKCYINNP